MEPDEVHTHLLSRFTDYAGAHLCAYCAFPGEVVGIAHPTEFPDGFVCDDCHETVPCWHAFPEVDDDTEATDLIQHLYALEKQYGIVVTVVTRGDIEDAWREGHFADGDDAPTFTDEMWDKFQDTWAWRKGLSEAMWDGVWETIQDGLRDIADPSFGRVV